MGILTITVQAYERVVAFRDGAYAGVLEAGRHRRKPRTSYVVVDVRERLLTTAPQEVPTADGLTVKVTAALRWRVIDPARFVLVTTDPEAALYLDLQLALREAVAAVDADDLAGSGRAAVGGAVTSAVALTAARVGVEVVAASVKDVVLPAEVRAAATELVTVRQRGLARLEAARAETAALRSLANGARLLDDHPALARLRLVEAAAGGTVVLHVPADPVRDAERVTS